MHIFDLTPFNSRADVYNNSTPTNFPVLDVASLANVTNVTQRESVDSTMEVASLAHPARMLFVRVALRAGGRDAYRRLVARPGATIGERLSSAAEMDIDSLVARWRNDALAARPKPLTLSWWASFAAIGWTAFFGFCALRSSRWRL